MKTAKIMRLGIALLYSALCGMTAQGAQITISKPGIHNIRMSQRVLRLDKNENLYVDDAGMSLEVSFNIGTSGLAGDRLLCFVVPTDTQGNPYADKVGKLMSMTAIDIPSASYNGTVKVQIPYNWLTAGDNLQLKSANFLIDVRSLKNEDVSTSKSINLSEAEIQYDKSKLAGSMLSDVLGGGGGSGNPVGDILSGLFGGADAEITEECPSCEGYRICPYCDGMGFFDPGVCRKCTADPGICRRCHGEGQLTRQVDIY